MSLERLASPAPDAPPAPIALPPLVLLYKHSPVCPVSSQAMTEVSTYADQQDSVPVVMLDVLGQQSLSRQLAAQLDVRHESPQVILVKDGKAVWSQSGWRIRLDAIERAADKANRNAA